MKYKKKKLKSRSRRQKYQKEKDPQDETLCMTKGQLMNVVIAAEVKGYKDAKKKQKPQKCCPKAKEFVKGLKAEMRRNRNHA